MSDDSFIEDLRALELTPPALTDEQLSDPAERRAWLERVEATVREIKALRGLR